MHRRAAQSQVGYGLLLLHGVPHGRSQALQHLPVKRPFIALRGDPMLFQNALRREVTAGRVMLMHRMHRHAIHVRTRRFGQGLPECVMAFTADADPVHRAQHNRFTRTRQHNTPRPKTHVPGIYYGIISQVRPDRWCGVNIKNGELQPGRFFSTGKRCSRQRQK
ncbi:MAG: hypothetical protein BWX80_03945 [Candidatus Hydrogenedentes bacterium ADurb.Bin101]|nr:MAG: hypothetical protein BWX80_03945 [Candidatus Hydrogenedentes bacterium ADurb.Bin101]